MIVEGVSWRYIEDISSYYIYILYWKSVHMHIRIYIRIYIYIYVCIQITNMRQHRRTYIQWATCCAHIFSKFSRQMLRKIVLCIVYIRQCTIYRQKQKHIYIIYELLNRLENIYSTQSTYNMVYYIKATLHFYTLLYMAG